MTEKLHIDPLNEGIDHINIYSKSSTKLGRFLSNLTYAPFSLHRIGRVMTMEGLYYYLQTGEQFPKLLGITKGHIAKKIGLELCEQYGRTPKDDWRLYLYMGALAKINTYPEYSQRLRKALKDGLWFTHYYYYGTATSGYKIIDKSLEDHMVKIYYRIADTLLNYDDTEVDFENY